MYKLIRKFKKSFRSKGLEINPEDIFIDSANLPGLNRDRLEGRIEKPIDNKTFNFLQFGLSLVVLLLIGRLVELQVVEGRAYTEISENNRLNRLIIFADRGVIFDKNKVPLAENTMKLDEDIFAKRKYADLDGISAVLGYIKYPRQDSQGRFYDESYLGQAGAEKQFNSILSGKNGSKLIETDALGNVISESVVEAPLRGGDVYLSIDSRVTSKLFEIISQTAIDREFKGGAGVIMDVRTGEILSLTSYPEVDLNIVTEGSDDESISKFLVDKNKPFLNRVVSGLYTPGSIVKPIVAIGALNEGVITPDKQILSDGSITVPNPYDPSKSQVFKDWKVHGWLDMRSAIAVSSSVYFYEIGGGFENQKGLGITKINEYFSLFGLDEKTGIDLPSEVQSYFATPAWKAINFPEDPDWRLGNTYHTAIGQYGTQVTPINAVRFIASVANGGKLVKPTILLGRRSEGEEVVRNINLNEDLYKVIQEGMRASVTRGTAMGVSNEFVRVAAKTGTAELGVKKDRTNSWIVGFFPYEEPKYAFAIIMESGPATNTTGGVFVMRSLIDWMAQNTTEYFE